MASDDASGKIHPFYMLDVALYPDKCNEQGEFAYSQKVLEDVKALRQDLDRLHSIRNSQIPVHSASRHWNSTSLYPASNFPEAKELLGPAAR